MNNSEDQQARDEVNIPHQRKTMPSSTTNKNISEESLFPYVLFSDGMMAPYKHQFEHHLKTLELYGAPSQIVYLPLPKKKSKKKSCCRYTRRKKLKLWLTDHFLGPHLFRRQTSRCLKNENRNDFCGISEHQAREKDVVILRRRNYSVHIRLPFKISRKLGKTFGNYLKPRIQSLIETIKKAKCHCHLQDMYELDDILKCIQFQARMKQDEVLLSLGKKFGFYPWFVRSEKLPSI